MHEWAGFMKYIHNGRTGQNPKGTSMASSHQQITQGQDSQLILRRENQKLQHTMTSAYAESAPNAVNLASSIEVLMMNLDWVGLQQLHCPKDVCNDVGE